MTSSNAPKIYPPLTKVNSYLAQKMVELQQVKATQK